MPVGRLAHNGWHDKILPSSAGRFPHPYLLFGLFGLRLILIKATLFRQQSAREGKKPEIERQRGREGAREVKKAARRRMQMEKYSKGEV